MNYDYLSAEEFDLMTEDELNFYYKSKNNTIMEEKNVKPTISATTQNDLSDDTLYLGTVESIWNSEYEEEMGICIFEMMTYNGTSIKLALKPNQIKELNLFLMKEEANQRYVNHILKN